MKSWKKIALAGGLALAMILSLAGCGAAKSVNNMTESSWGGDNSGVYDDKSSMEYDSVGWNGDAAPGDNGGPEDGIPRESKMIYTARLTLETVEFDKTVYESIDLQAIQRRMQKRGGFFRFTSIKPLTERIDAFDEFLHRKPGKPAVPTAK